MCIDNLDNNLWLVLVRHFPTGARLTHLLDDNVQVYRTLVAQEIIARNNIKNMS